MAKDQTPEQNTARAGQNKSTTPASSGKKSSGKKNNRPQIGGSAVQGAKSTLPRQTATTNNPQQQEIDSYNRMMRRRMQQIGAGPYSERKIKTPQERRKEKIERIKQKRAEHVQAVKRSLPGGQLKADTSGATRMVLVVGGLIVLLIAVFVVLRLTGVIG